MFFFILFTEDDPRQLDVDSFIDEALRMKDFHHPNVLTLTGICFGMDDMPLVILPFMQHGDLLSYIRNEKNVSWCLFLNLWQKHLRDPVYSCYVINYKTLSSGMNHYCIYFFNFW